MEHKKSTKSQKEYVRTLIHGLSLQRLTDQEITDYLHNEKQVDIARSTVTYIRNNIEKSAEKWYIELKQSRYKYIAIYKERIDSLLSYQKKLHQIIEFYIRPPDQMLYTDTVIRTITELHKIEISIFNIWKQLPDLDITDQNGTPKREIMSFDDWRYNKHSPRLFEDSHYSDEENGKYYWDLHKEYGRYVSDINKNLNADWLADPNDAIF